jgi:hypothetical protein
VSEIVIVRGAFGVAGFLAALALIIGPVNSGQLSSPAVASMSCFTEAGAVSCVQTADAPPVMPVAPLVMVPVGPHVDGEDQDIVIRDDGGHEVARG